MSKSVFTVGGFGFVGQGQNVGLAFVRLKDWSERPGARTVSLPSPSGRMRP